MSRLGTGGSIDRTRPIAFRFDGRTYRGFEGDSLASALLANDVRLIGRSFKYHRPRGILTAGAEEPNALVTLRSGARAEPNMRATTIELYEGLEASSQNCWPGPRFDLMAVNRLLSPIFVAGFYYKTFMWPSSLWEKLYEPLIRRAAGLGRLSGKPDPDCYDRSHAFADLLIVGGGPAGLTAALAAGRAGIRVLLVEEDRQLGGRLLAERHTIDGMPGEAWAKQAAAELRGLPTVTLLTRTSLFGAYDGGTYAAVERVFDHVIEPLPGQPRQRLWKIQASRAILATGAVERPITFGGNDRPGVMMASAAQAYVNRYAVAPGRRAAVFTNSDSGHAVASDLKAAGVEVVAVIDPRPNVDDTPSGVPLIRGVVVGTSGRDLRAIKVRDSQGAVRSLAVDLLAVAGGWNPAIGIASHGGARPVWSAAVQAFVMDAPPPGMMLAGAAAGRFTLAEALADGVEKAGGARSEIPSATPERAGVAEPLIVDGCRQKAFIDFQNDVTTDDVMLAEREGYRSVEHLKRYTTLGMATDQGKATQVNGHALLAKQAGRAIAEVGTIAARPPYSPVALGVLVGLHRAENLRPTRRTATHDWAAERGAIFVDAGLWKRAQWFPREGETVWLESVTREARTVRRSVGLCDVSTLGKIELCGPDAPVLLDRLYANMMSTLAVGKCRYGLMLREDGFVLDDGTVARLAEDRFVLTTTTANAMTVMRHVDFAVQVLWPDLDVQAVSVTEQWTQISVAGPNSRALLQGAFPDVDMSDAAIPFMGNLLARWRDAPMRLFRLSFSGELAYEVAVPANHGDALMRTLADIGEHYGCVAYGTETLGVLRIEKGHIAGGELNGQVTAGDLGMARLLSTKKDFIGRTMAGRAALVDPDRPRLVGLRPVADSQRLTAGAHLIARNRQVIAAHTQGHVTSACFSPAMGQWIGLGLLAQGAERIGERVSAVSPLRNSVVEVEVCGPTFVDPTGGRLRG